eukprot:CAMPEP_0114533992 /NCGR_PEP_ID=MMETSP0109-20121206/27572_1 /TAXON_ID=29199 /ORGANISM="Chlorarachnion reptans, Strain CCCM449" /LENGTH=523 /DNA_ID=CAMNT_0001717315 /DNA_START=50 /DNA_END=1622 /DNA_ORIENTATION=-
MLARPHALALALLAATAAAAAVSSPLAARRAAATSTAALARPRPVLRRRSVGGEGPAARRISTTGATLVATGGQDESNRVPQSPLLKVKRDLQYGEDSEFVKPGESALLDEILADVKQLSREGEVMKRPSISSIFFTILASTLISGLAPFSFPESIAEVLIPTAASIIAVITAACEFQGKDATSDAKEVAAVALAQAARCEAYLARAEKAKAILPAMVGLSATGATLNLIFPALMAAGATVNPVFIGMCPIAATTAAVIGAIASTETIAQGLLAMGKVDQDRIISVREANSAETRRKILFQRTKAVLKSTLPSILVFAFLPGAFVFKCIVAGAAAALAVAYQLAEAETVVAEVGLKVAYVSKAAAQADVFANKAAAEASLLPFTSAIAGVSTALAAAMVEVNPVIAGLIPIVGAVACGVATAAGTRAEMDATTTRLIFRDAGIRKVAPLANVPTLFQNVVPSLLGSMIKQGAQISGKFLNSVADSASKGLNNGNDTPQLPNKLKLIEDEGMPMLQAPGQQQAQ